MAWSEAVIVAIRKYLPFKYENKYNVDVRFIGEQSSQVFVFACVVFSYMYSKNNSSIH